MGNAAVMGFIPQMRYILMSDLLLETMTDAQIEAVFAHEVGHIVHRHMAWYVVFFIALTLWVGAGPGVYLGQYATTAGLPAWMPVDLLMTIVYAAAFLLTFGYVSRHFERQADVFAARTIEKRVPDAAESILAAPRASHVGRYGASIFASALHRVAMVNNIPVAARSWCHGSIHKRMQYLHHLSADPAHTARFDRFMTCLYALLLAALVAGGAFLVVAGR
jgi:STE24 endopeptidase